MAVITTNLTCELQEAVKVQYLKGNLFSQDVQANKISVSVYDGGEPASISGTVTANIIREDGGTVTATGGTISGNVVSITLPAAAYIVPGLVSIVIKVTASSVTTTIAAVVVNVYQSSTETAIDPGTIIPSVTALVAQIETAVASIPADYSSLWTSLAPAFSSSASYTPGQYVTNGGVLYVCTTAHTGSWNASHFSAVNVGGELTRLNGALTALPNDIGASFKAISEQKTAQGVGFVSVNSNGERIRLTTESEITIHHLKKNLFPFNNIPAYSYAWSQINTKAGMPNPVFLKGGRSYIISTDKNTDESKFQVYIKAAKPDGTWITDTSAVNFHNQTKTSGTTYRDSINAFYSNTSYNNNGIAFITPTVDMYVDMVISSTSGTATGNHPMIEASDSNTASEYEKYVLLETITVNGTVALVPSCGTNTIIAESGTFDIVYNQVSDIVNDIEKLQYEKNHIYNGDYTSELKGTSNVVLNVSIGSTIDLSPLNTAGTSHYTLLIDDVVEGEYFQIYAVDGTVSRPWAFLDSDNKLLSVAYNAYAQNVVITAPQNAKKLLVQVGSSYLSGAKVIRANSLLFLSSGTSVDINTTNNQYDVSEKLENATSITKGDSSTTVKSRSNLFTLLHLSDIHGDTANIQRVLDFSYKYNDYIMDIIHTGDAPTTYYGNDNPFAYVGGNQIMEVVGNHECWIQGETWPRPYTATAQQVYEKYFAPYISSWNVNSPGTNHCYYYKDYATAKVRLIVLDCIHYDSEQEMWFISALAGAKSNSYRVVAVTHYPAMTGLTNIECTFGTYGESIIPQTPPTGTDQVERMPESAFEKVDDFIDGGGEFVCWLSGHTHGDFIGTVTGHEDQIQIIITTAKPMNGNGDAARVAGTKTQDAFNVFVVDGTNKLIKLVRIGADRDKYLRKRETLCLNYQTKTVISNT